MKGRVARVLMKVKTKEKKEKKFLKQKLILHYVGVNIA